MEEKIKHVLIVRCNYTAAEARETAKDICNFSSKDLRDAVRKWMYTDEMVDIHEGRFTVSGLMKTTPTNLRNAGRLPWTFL